MHAHVLLFITFMLTVSAAPPSVTIKDLRLFVDQDEYFIKGVSYSPSPLAKVYDGQQGGSGLCTPRPAYATGSYSNVIQLSGCNSEDYFDGTVYNPGPAGGWWNGVWERDFPLLQQLGANTIRIYHTYPITQAAIDADPRYNQAGVQGSNHIPFMDLAESYNLKVVFPLFADQVALDSLSDEWIQLYITYLIDEVGDHPALLMYTFGNELQFWTLPASFAARVDSFVRYARAYQMQKWNRYIPVTVALIDYPPYYDGIVQSISFDIITTNSGYRGFDFSDLWAGNSGSGFSGMYALSCKTGKPLLVGEMGVHNNTPVFNTEDWFRRMWSDILNHKAQGAIGGFLFSFQEEHWKGVTPVIDWKTMPDVNMGVITLDPGSGTYPVDIAVKKDYGAYDFNSVAQGFAQNQWAQDGPNKLSTVTNNFCGSSTVTAPQVGGNAAINSNPNPTSTSSGNSGSNNGGGAAAGPCGSGLSQCGQACYKSTEYCCVSNTLYPTGSAQCSSTNNGGPAAGSSTNGNAASSGASSNNNGATAGSSTTGNAASTGASTNNGGAAAGSSTNGGSGSSTGKAAGSSTTGNSASTTNKNQGQGPVTSVDTGNKSTNKNTPTPTSQSGSSGNSGSSGSSGNSGNSGSSTGSGSGNGNNDNGGAGGVNRPQNSAGTLAIGFATLAAVALLI